MAKAAVEQAPGRISRAVRAAAQTTNGIIFTATTEQQWCRWLLSSLDRLSSDSLSMTQDIIANMLGLRSEGIAKAAEHLQRAGLIRYRHDHIEALDRPGLERTACECYALVKRGFDRLLLDISRGDPFHGRG